MLPEETKQRIEREASEYAKDVPDNACFELCDGYIAGATAEAEKAQRLADALEQITTAKRLPDEGTDKYKANRMWHIAVNALQKWRAEK